MVMIFNVADMTAPNDPQGRTYRQANADKTHAMHDLRTCVAYIRNELSKTLMRDAEPIDAAQVLNETGDVALKYDCYDRKHKEAL